MKWKNLVRVVAVVGLLISAVACAKKDTASQESEMIAPPPAAAPAPDMPETPPADQGTQGGGQ